MRDLRERQVPLSQEEIADFETEVFAGLVMARASAGLTDSTIRNDTHHLEAIREWFGRPLWEMQVEDSDVYFGKELREKSPATRTGRAGALTVYFQFLELRHRAEIFNLTGRPVEVPLDEMNRPRASIQVKLRVPPSEAEIEQLFAGWRQDLMSARKFAPAARNYTVARVAADVGLRINEMRMLDLDDLHWDLGSFGKLNVRHGKGSRRRGPKPRMVPLINGADSVLRWFVEDVWGEFSDDHALPGVPLFPSERHTLDGRTGRVTAEVFRRSLAEATAAHLPTWTGKLTPHVLRHYCASQLYAAGMTLLAVQELLGHSWIATTMRYIHVHRAHIEQAWMQGQARVADRWKGLTSR